MEEGFSFPSTLRELQKELLEHSKKGRNDIPFRIGIVNDNYGAYCRHITHDRALNPISRPLGTTESRVSDAGHFLVQAMTLVAMDGIDLDLAVCLALQSLRGNDFIAKAPAAPGLVKGEIAHWPPLCRGGVISAKALVCKHTITYPPVGMQWTPQILIASCPPSDKRLGQFVGIVTDHGGTTCHAAITDRENDVPCIVGTGNATDRIKTGDTVVMDLHTGIVTVVPESSRA